jgi:hypothetical protein
MPRRANIQRKELVGAIRRAAATWNDGLAFTIAPTLLIAEDVDAEPHAVRDGRNVLVVRYGRWCPERRKDADDCYDPGATAITHIHSRPGAQGTSNGEPWRHPNWNSGLWLPAAATDECAQEHQSEFHHAEYRRLAWLALRANRRRALELRGLARFEQRGSVALVVASEDAGALVARASGLVCLWASSRQEQELSLLAVSLTTVA